MNSTQRKRMAVHITVFLLALSILLSSCGGNKPTTTTPSNSKEIEVLKVGMPMIPDYAAIDLLNNSNNQGARVGGNMFDALLKIDKENNIVGRLAESWEWLDDQTIQLKLRDGVTFHNGYPFSAEDVKFTWDRIQAAEMVGTTSAKTSLGMIESVDIIDRLTIQIKTNIVDISFENRLMDLTCIAVCSKQYIEEVGYDAYLLAPIGTGAFALKSVSPERIVIERYDGYWGEAPNVKTIEYLLYSETASRYTALVNGEIDIMFDVPGDLRSTVANTPGIKLFELPNHTIQHVWFNVSSDGPTGNRDFRQALARSIDRELLVKTFWGAGSYVPFGVQFKNYNELLVEEYEGMLAYDVEVAKEYLAKSGYNGEPIEIRIRPGHYAMAQDVLQAIMGMWSEHLGVNSFLVLDPNWAFNPFADVSFVATSSRFNNHDGVLGAVLTRGISWLNHAWSEEDIPQEYMDLMAEYRSTMDVGRRKEIAARVLSIFDDIMPMVPLYTWERYTGVRDGLHFDLGEYTDIVFDADVLWAE